MAPCDWTTGLVQDILNLKAKPPGPRKATRNVGNNEDDLTEDGQRDKKAAEQKKDALIQQWRQQQATLQQIQPSESDTIEECQEDKRDKEGKEKPYRRNEMGKDGS